MKKIISLFLVAILIISFSAVAASAFDTAVTEIEVAKGDTVTYTLNASNVAEPVICADFSIYYDSNIFTCESYSNEPEGSVVNKDLEGEVRGNWVNLKGVDFTKTAPVITVTLKAISDGTANISYYMRDFCCDKDDEIVEITTYEFTATVEVNSNVVIDNKPAELNVEENQDIGNFSNSASGSSKDAGIIVSKGVSNIDSGQAVENVNNEVNGDEVNEDNVQSSQIKSEETSKASESGKETTKAEQATDSKGNVVEETKAVSNNSTSDIAVTTEQNNSGGPSIWLWIIIGIVVLAGGGTAGYMIYKKKSSSSGNDDINNTVQ